MILTKCGNNRIINAVVCKKQNGIEQPGPGYDPQAAVMRWPPLATTATLTPGGSILTRDVRLKERLIHGVY